MGQTKFHVWPEIWLVLLLSLGQSAIYAMVRLVDLYTRGPLSEGQADLNTQLSPRPWFDLTYQLLGIGFAVVPVALALWLMSKDPGEEGPVQRTGLNFSARQTPRDLGWAFILFAIIGAGTLGVYFVGRSLGITAEISTNNLGQYWWTVPVLILHALKNAVLEEVLLLSYGVDRLQKAGWTPWLTIAVLAVVRGSYHLYQGWGPFVGNVAMGLLFGYLYLRSGRAMPFVGAHALIDTVGFLAPGVLAAVDPV